MLVRTIEFVFENCETVEIDGKYIGDLYIGDIKQEIARMACNYIGIEDICNSFFIEIHKDANKEYSPFGIADEKSTVFDRILKYYDITQIDITLYDEDDKTQKDIHKHYLLNWNDEDEYTNKYQNVKVAKTGWLYISVSETKTISDFIQTDAIDTEEYADFTSSMYDIGDKNS